MTEEEKQMVAAKLESFRHDAIWVATMLEKFSEELDNDANTIAAEITDKLWAVSTRLERLLTL